MFELPLRGKDETEGSTNPGIFLGLVNFVAQLDEVFDDHLKNAKVFKGTSKTIQNELLECMGHSTDLVPFVIEEDETMNIKILSFFLFDVTK